MTDAINLITEDLTIRYPEAIDLGRGSQREVPVVQIIESADSISYLFLFLHIPRFIDTTEHHLIGEVERGSYIQITQDCKVRLDGNTMRHTVFPILAQTGMQQFIFLRINLILQLTSIADRDLFIPFCIAYSLLSLKGVELGYADIDIRQCHGNRRITHILIQVHRRVERQTKTGKRGLPCNRRCSYRLCPRLRIIHRIQIILLIT